LEARDLSYWSTTHRRWVLEGGVFELGVGASSRDLRLTAPPLPVRLDGMATLQEWLAHPEGSTALRQAVGSIPTAGRAGSSATRSSSRSSVTSRSAA
jgi:beta-glucosidase